MSKQIVTENLKSENRVVGNIDVKDFFRIGIYMGICVALKGSVHSFFIIPYFILSFLFAIFLTSRSSFNKNRRNYESILLLIRKDREVYMHYEEDNYGGNK